MTLWHADVRDVMSRHSRVIINLFYIISHLWCDKVKSQSYSILAKKWGQFSFPLIIYPQMKWRDISEECLQVRTVPLLAQHTENIEFGVHKVQSCLHSCPYTATGGAISWYESSNDYSPQSLNCPQCLSPCVLCWEEEQVLATAWPGGGPRRGTRWHAGGVKLKSYRQARVKSNIIPWPSMIILKHLQNVW